jgi:ComF family protein
MPAAGASVSKDESARDECGVCRRRKYCFDKVVPLGVYEGAVRQAVLRMKRAENDYLARAMAELYWRRRGAELAALKPDVVIPVPMYWRRRMNRGVNSPETLAAKVSRCLGVPFERRMLIRCRRTRPQAELSPSKRIENVRGAFRLEGGYDIKGIRVLVVDDIMTTGATCSEIAKVLRAAGAESVCAAILARTLGGGHR